MKCQHENVSGNDDAKTTKDEGLHGLITSREEEGVAHIHTDVADDSLHTTSCHYCYHDTACAL